MSLPLIATQARQAHLVRFWSALALAVVLAQLMACNASIPSATSTPAPTDVPIGGVRPTITRQDLAAARDHMAGGLLEPCWLPDGFHLDHIAYFAPERSADLWYGGGDHYLHIWQVHRQPAELGSDDPVTQGNPRSTETDEWRVRPLSAAQVGESGIVEYSSRWADGRTLSIDSDLDADVMERVLGSICVRAEAGATDD